MKRRIQTCLLFAVLGVLALVVVKMTIPLGYADAPIHPEALSYVDSLQDRGLQDPKAIATRYLYFKTDYQDARPGRIEVSSTELDPETVRVRIYDPSCEDDSITSSIHRVYLRRQDSGRWIPVRVEWSHQGRGRFGWTTEPTT